MRDCIGITVKSKKEQPIEEIFHNRLLEAYHCYLIIGGMPECVSSWVRYKDPAKVAQIQRELIEVYENDFSKHNGKVNSGRILMVFRSIVSQLAKPNEKFMYGAVQEGARAREFEEAIEWLVSAGMLNRVYNVSKMEHPLSAFDKLDRFKLFVFDTGLLKQMAGLDNSAILLKNDYQFKGPLTENYVLQQLRGQFDVEPRYYSDKNSEIDFVLQYGTEIIPIEAKGGKTSPPRPSNATSPNTTRPMPSASPSAATAKTVKSPICRSISQERHGSFCENDLKHYENALRGDVLAKKNQIKRDSTFDEIYALLVVNYLYPGFIDKACKWESPDWKINGNAYGLEVTRAQNNHIGYTQNVMTKYLGMPRDQIPVKMLTEFRGWTYFKEGKLLAISDSKGLVNGNRHVLFLLEHLEKKIKKLNAPYFTICKQNFLFEFGTGCFNEQDKLQFSDGIKDLAQHYTHIFDRIFVSTHDDVFCFFPDGNYSEHIVPVQDLTQTADLYRNLSKWEKGSLSCDIERQFNAQQE